MELGGWGQSQSGDRSIPGPVADPVDPLPWALLLSSPGSPAPPPPHLPCRPQAGDRLCRGEPRGKACCEQQAELHGLGVSPGPHSGLGNPLAPEKGYQMPFC